MLTDAVRRLLGRGPEHLTRAHRVATQRAYQTTGFQGRRQLVRIWPVDRLTRAERSDPKRRALQRARARACHTAEVESAVALLRDAAQGGSVPRQQRRRAEMVVAKAFGHRKGVAWRNARATIRAGRIKELVA